MALSTETLHHNIKHFKYQGEDRSLLYRYFHSPLAQFIVDHMVPSWLAPNLITLLGFLLVVLSHIFLTYFAPDLTDLPPAWSLHFTSISLLIYAVLDNMDGKQARKTSSANSIGLLFDHGCDALNTGILTSLNFATAIQIGGTPDLIVYWACFAFPFYINTWEEFHVDKFILPSINGPNEGLIVGMVVTSLAGLFPGLWTTRIQDLLPPEVTAQILAAPAEESFWVWLVEQPLRRAMIVVLIIASVFTTASALVNVFRHIFSNEPYRPGMPSENPPIQPVTDFMIALGRLLPCLVSVCAVVLYWVYLPHVVIEFPRLLFFTTGLAVAHSVICIMSCHITKLPIVWNFTSLAAIWLPLVSLLFGFNSVVAPFVPECLIPLGWTSVQAVDLLLMALVSCMVFVEAAMFTRRTIRMFQGALKCALFTITPKRD